MRERARAAVMAQAIGLTGSLLLLAACGGGGGSTSGVAGGNPPPVSGSTVSSIVNFADSPSDRVVAFQLTINSMKLTRSDGSILNVLSTPRRIEVTHISGSAEPLALPSIPQGTYTSASILVSAPDVVYIDNTGKTVEKQDAAATKTWNLAFTPALQVGALPVVLTMDVNARASLTIDPVSGAVTMNPVATMQGGNIAQSQTAQDVESGDLQHIVGQVTAASANSFTINTGAGAISITFATSGSTAFEGASGAASLALNTMVRVEGNTHQDGTLLATEVEAFSASGSEMEGIVTATSGNPVSALNLVVQDLNGSGLDSSLLGSQMNVSISSKTKFRIDQGNIDLSGLNLPSFSMSNLSKGQRVEVESEAAPGSGMISADTIKLQEQAVVGAISSISSSQFTLTVPDDSALKLLTGKNTLNVYTQRNTTLKNGAAVTPGAVIKVRGLMFFDSTQGSFVIVAGRIATP